MYNNLGALLKQFELVTIGKEGQEFQTKVDNEKNVITIRREGSIMHINTFLAGVVSVEEFIEVLQIVQDVGIRFESECEPWLTPEFIEQLLECKERIQSNKITHGMQKTEKPLGRPSDKGKVQLALKLYESGNYTGTQIEKIAGVSRSTLYRYIKKKKGV